MCVVSASQQQLSVAVVSVISIACVIVVVVIVVLLSIFVIRKRSETLLTLCRQIWNIKIKFNLKLQFTIVLAVTHCCLLELLNLCVLRPAQPGCPFLDNTMSTKEVARILVLTVWHWRHCSLLWHSTVSCLNLALTLLRCDLLNTQKCCSYRQVEHGNERGSSLRLISQPPLCRPRGKYVLVLCFLVFEVVLVLCFLVFKVDNCVQ